ELIETLAWAHERTPLANLIRWRDKSIALSIVQARTMDTTINQQVAIDEDLVPHAKRLRIERSNFCLLSDIKSKESTIQLVLISSACVYSSRLSWLLQMFLKSICRNSRRQPLSMIMLFDSRWIIRSISLIWNHSGTCYISIRESLVNLLLNHHLKRKFLPSFVFLDTMQRSGSSLMLTSTSYISHEDPLLPSSVEHKDSKKSNKMYYPRFKKVIIHHFMSKDPLIPRRNKYYVVATGAVPPKPNASVRKTRRSSDKTITPPTAAAGPRLTTSRKGKQEAKATKAKSLSALSEEVERDDEKDDEEEGGDDEQEYDEETRDEESFDPISNTPKNSDDEGNGEEDIGLNVYREEGHDEEEEEDKLYRDVNINQGRGIQTTQEFKDSHVTPTPVNPD
nr:photosystem I P700 chlorophyll a apoprotein A2, chloroplastic [Tanacetum cinerariifolium]